jgi:hypothetical protein
MIIICAALVLQARLGVVTEDDAPALVLRIFARYLSLMRRVQTTYWCVAVTPVWLQDVFRLL